MIIILCLLPPMWACCLMFGSICLILYSVNSKHDSRAVLFSWFSWLVSQKIIHVDQKCVRAYCGNIFRLRSVYNYWLANWHIITLSGCIMPLSLDQPSEMQARSYFSVITNNTINHILSFFFSLPNWINLLVYKCLPQK